MELISMKMSKKEKTEMSSPPSPLEMPSYPYGLNISLNDESIEKLGIKEMPEPGTKVMVTAMADVVSCSMSENEKGKDRRMELQITDMGIMQGSKKNTSDILYSK